MSKKKFYWSSDTKYIIDTFFKKKWRWVWRAYFIFIGKIYREMEWFRRIVIHVDLHGHISLPYIYIYI